MSSCSSRVLVIAVAMFFVANCGDADEVLDVERAVEEAKQMMREDLARIRDVEQQMGYHATYHIRAQERGIELLETRTPKELADPSLVWGELRKIQDGPGYILRLVWLETGFRAQGLRFRVRDRISDYPEVLRWPDEIREEYAHGLRRSRPVVILLETESEDEIVERLRGQLEVIQIPWKEVPQQLEVALLFDGEQQTEFVDVLLPHQIDARTEGDADH